MSTPSPWITRAALAAMTVSFGLNFTSGVFFTPAAAEYHLDVSALAIAAALATALTGAAQTVIGRLLDKAGAKWVLVGGLASISIGYAVLAAVVNTWQFITVFTVLVGLGFASASSLTVTTLLGRAHGEKVAPALARASIGINLGQLIGPWAATSLFAPIGVRGAYLALGGAGILVTALLALTLPGDRAPGTSAGRESLRGRGPTLVSFGLHSAVMYVVVLLLPKHATEAGWTAVGAGRLVALAALTAGITSALLPRLLRGNTPEAILRVLYLLRAAVLVLAAVDTSSASLIIVAALFGIASFPAIPLTMAILSRGLDRSRMGRTLAPAWVIHQLAAAAGLGVAVGVHALTDGHRAYWALGAALSLGAAALLTRRRATALAAV